MEQLESAPSLRCRLARDGAESLSEAELLAIVISHESCHKAATDRCQHLLNKFGGLTPLLLAKSHEFHTADGIGDAYVASLRALPELAKRYFEGTLPVGKTISNPQDTAEFLTAKLRDLPHEMFCCLYLDNRHRIIQFVELFRGTIDGTSVYPREVVKQALSLNAAAVIAAHNHPSGVTEPSKADESITRRLKSALELVDIRLLDHLIVGGNRCRSLAERGLL